MRALAHVAADGEELVARGRIRLENAVELDHQRVVFVFKRAVQRGFCGVSRCLAVPRGPHPARGAAQLARGPNPLAVQVRVYAGELVQAQCAVEIYKFAQKTVYAIVPKPLFKPAAELRRAAAAAAAEHEAPRCRLVERDVRRVEVLPPRIVRKARFESRRDKRIRAVPLHHNNIPPRRGERVARDFALLEDERVDAVAQRQERIHDRADRVRVGKRLHRPLTL
mmetsp:Transcript_6531/g.21051  ORF Transcript_6531/g.21051 Transcript_6531/m.21051 type:complete len:224 (+) Transcript_6531:382-1053(+)